VVSLFYGCGLTVSLVEVVMSWCSCVCVITGCGVMTWLCAVPWCGCHVVTGVVFIWWVCCYGGDGTFMVSLWCNGGCLAVIILW